jgi:hypothetical protein
MFMHGLRFANRFRGAEELTGGKSVLAPTNSLMPITPWERWRRFAIGAIK